MSYIQPSCGARPFSFLRTRQFWAVCAIVMVSRLVLLAFALWLPGDDGPRYWQEALNLRDFGIFSNLNTPWPAPTAHDLPLYPLLLSLLLRLVPALGVATKIAGALNALFFTAAVGALFGIASLLSRSAKIALFSSLLLAVFPETLPYSLFYMPDSMFLAVFLWSIAVLIAFFEVQKPLLLFSAFALLGLSILIKPASLFFGAVFALWILFWPSTFGLGRRVLWVACGLILELAVVSPWMWRNASDFGQPVLSTITGTNLFRENYRLLVEDTHPRDAGIRESASESAVRQAAGPAWDNPVEQSDLLGAFAKREISSHFPAYLRMTAKRHPRLYFGTGSLALLRLVGDDRDTAALEAWQSHPSVAGAKSLPRAVLVLQVISWAVLALAYAGALAGAVVLARRHAWTVLAVPLLALLYFAAIIGPVTYTRYRMPMSPFFALLAAYGLSWAAAQIASRRYGGVPERVPVMAVIH